MSKKSPAWALALLLLAGVALLGRDWIGPRSDREGAAPAGTSPARQNDRIRQAFEEKQSRVWVEGQGVVDRILRDDLKGSKHQQWILRLTDGLTLKFAHNIDLAERVPLSKGDTLSFRGRYEWNPKGGVIHWTHRDPRGKQAGGWIQHAGKRYR